MSATRWLAIYITDNGDVGAAMITPREQGDMPFGVSAAGLGMTGCDGSCVTFVEMPDDPTFRPMIVDSDNDEEVALQFIDL